MQYIRIHTCYVPTLCSPYEPERTTSDGEHIHMNLRGHPLQRTHAPREPKQGHPRLTCTWWGTHMNPRGHFRTANTYMTQERKTSIWWTYARYECKSTHSSEHGLGCVESFASAHWNTYMTQERTPSIGEHMTHMTARIHTQSNVVGVWWVIRVCALHTQNKCIYVYIYYHFVCTFIQSKYIYIYIYLYM
jgi:hypothetical protein